MIRVIASLFCIVSQILPLTKEYLYCRASNIRLLRRAGPYEVILLKDLVTYWVN